MTSKSNKYDGMDQGEDSEDMAPKGDGIDKDAEGNK